MTILTREITANGVNIPNPNMLVPHWLMACYQYYCEHESLFSDPYFDALSYRLSVNWADVTHRHKHLIDPGNLNVTGAYLTETDYPSIICRSSRAWMLAN